MEDLMRSIDGYCERTDPSYWSEPVNAATNLAFLIAALVMWRRLSGEPLPLARALCVVLGLIGVGSYLFHTQAVVWTAIADTTPIAVFVLLYVFVANRAYWGLRMPWALLATAGFFPFVAVTLPVFQRLPFFDVSAMYWPVPLLIAIYAVALRHRAPTTARGLGIGAGILVVSLVFRSLDMAVCSSVPVGTHFIWHLLNGLMLGWMIEVYRRHMVAHRDAPPPDGAARL
jgi:hypothetical protein